jgi:DNA-binding NarL/FixJ family response regulator
MAAIRGQLDEVALATAWAEGRALSQEQAAALALAFPLEQGKNATPPITNVAPAPNMAANLTAREIEVLRLVATGLTNAQVAAQLIISPRIVNAHLNSIYGKLELTSRSAVTRFAVENHLI